MSLAAALILGAAGCGARSSLVAPEETVEGLDASVDGAVERVCLPNCTVGHECCAGSCDGPQVPTINSCCQCFPGEVNSFECDDGHCWGSP